MSFRRATLLVLNYNGKPLLEECLPSVVEAARFGGQRHEVIVIDNASSDGSVEFVREHYPDVKIRRMARNRYLFSYNRIISECETDWVVLLNNDVRVEADFLEPLLDHFGDRRVFAATPMVRSDKPTERFECRRYPILSRGVVNTRPDLSSHGIQLTLFAHGGASALDRRKFLSLGGFDSLYWTCLYEDVDLSYAAWLRGWHIVFEPRSRVFHKGGASLGRGGRQSAKWRRVEERVRTLFVLKNIEDRRMLTECLVFFGLRVLRALLTADVGRMRAHLDIALRWPRLVVAREKARQTRWREDAEVFRALRVNGWVDDAGASRSGEDVCTGDFTGERERESDDRDHRERRGRRSGAVSEDRADGLGQEKDRRARLAGVVPSG
jgi:GT2 family glycosyltransferase